MNRFSFRRRERARGVDVSHKSLESAISHRLHDSAPAEREYPPDS